MVKCQNIGCNKEAKSFLYGKHICNDCYFINKPGRCPSTKGTKMFGLMKSPYNFDHDPHKEELKEKRLKKLQTKRSKERYGKS